MEIDTLVFIVNKQQPDFIGRFLYRQEQGFVSLKQALSVEYVDARPTFSTDYMPVGGISADTLGMNVHLPKDNMLYMVELTKEDRMAELYEFELTLAKERLEERKAAQAEETVVGDPGPEVDVAPSASE